MQKNLIKNIILYEFQSVNKSTKAMENINSARGYEAVKIGSAYYWFIKFREVDLGLEDSERPGRPR
jgi:hypothetical protein